MKKSILTTILGAYLTIVSFGYYLKSFGFEDYGSDGKSTYADENQIIFFLTGLIILFVGIAMIKNFKQNKSSKVATFTGLSLIGAIHLCAPLKPAFKVVNKVIQKSAGYTFAQSLPYFLWAGFGLIILLYGVFSYLEYRKQK